MNANSKPIFVTARFHLLGGLCLFGLTGTFAAAADPGEIVQLPAYVVNDSQILPKPESWRYARVAGFEILSNSSDKETQRVVSDLIRFQFAVSIVWPPLQSKSPVPAALILCANKGKFSDFVPQNADTPYSGTASLTLRDREEAAIVLDLETKVLDLDTSGTGTPVDGDNPDRGIEVDSAQQLHREYLHLLFSRMNPRPQPWLEEGLAQLLTSMTYDQKEIVFGQLPNPNSATTGEALAAVGTALQSGAGGIPSIQAHDALSAAQNSQPQRQSGGGGGGQSDADGLLALDSGPAQDKAFNASLATAHLMALDKMFAVTRESPEARNTIGGLWAKQCWLFVHLCLYGENQRYAAVR